MAAPAALGFRLHTGWAALVAIAGVPGKFQVLLRRRIELLPRGDSVPRFVYQEVWRNVSTSWSLKEEEMRTQVDGLRKSVGAPWGTDQKTATAFALLALREVTDTKRGRGISPGK
jgi:hypothetical protein